MFYILNFLSAKGGKSVFSVLCMTMMMAAVSSFSTSVDAGDVSGHKHTEEADPVEWFRDAKFGMFIHWGLYSQTGGVWNGEKYYGITEWLMRRGEISSKDYKRISKDFNPVDFDAEKWVSIAKESGVKYIVITSKHHDGFALFDSAVSDFDIIDASPFKRDPMKELTTAARAAGIKIGFYYSQYQDWTEKDAGGNEWEFDPKEKNLQTYLRNKAMPQLEELLTNYGPIDIIWFDTPGTLSLEESKELKAWVKNLQPNCLVTDRIGHNLGDYKGYRDGEIPAVPQPGRPWEAIFTHNDSWGYSEFDNNFKSTSEVLDLLVTTAGKGGNLMLNVGPDGRGGLPDESVFNFLEVGKWLKVNGESIYGTEGSPIGSMPWGHMTQRPGTLYLHVMHAPKNHEVIVPRLKAGITSVSLLATGEKLEWRKSNGDVFVSLPDRLPDSLNTVVVVNHKEGLIPQSEPELIVSNQYDEMKLEASRSTINGKTSVRKFSTMHYFGDWKHDWAVKGLDSGDGIAEWEIRVVEPGAYKIYLEYSADASEAGQEGILSLNGKDFFFKVLETGEFFNPGGFAPRKPLIFFEHPVAVVRFAEAGTYTLSVRPDRLRENTELFKLRNVIIESHD